jgi:hypothetical protein
MAKIFCREVEIEALVLKNHHVIIFRHHSRIAKNRQRDNELLKHCFESDNIYMTTQPIQIEREGGIGGPVAIEVYCALQM